MATNVKESKNVSKRSAKKVKEVDFKLSPEHITLIQECRKELEQFASQRKDFLQTIGDIDDRDTTEDNNEEVILNTISSYLSHAFKQYDKIASHEVLCRVREKLGDVIAETGAAERLCVYVNNALNKMVKPTTGDVTVTSTLYNVLKVLANYSDGSTSLCQELAENRSYLKACQQFLARKDICKRIKANNTLKDDDPGSDFLDCLLTTLHNIASRDELALSMQKVGFTDALKFHLSNTNRNVWMQVLAILAAVVTEDECDIIKSNHKRVGELLSVLEHGLEQEDLRYEGWSCFEVAHTIRVLARNDANKRMLVQMDAFKLLVALAKTGGKREKMESIQSLWVLCFDKDNKEEAINNKELGIKDLLTDLKVYKDKDIANTSVRVLWILRDVFETSALKRTQTFEKDKHIMLSYNHQHREIMMQIKAELRRHGFTVWMDVDNISGSTLESMAKAVEEAAIILICMSQLYKDSNYCRAEAEYSFLLKKKVIPLRMDLNYKPDGWLGLMIGTKLFFDFSGKYEFQDKMGDLLKEIDTMYPAQLSKVQQNKEQSLDDADDNTDADGHERSTKENALYIDSSPRTYLLRGCIPATICADELTMLVEMRQEAPEFFYKCLYDMYKIRDPVKLAKFVKALRELRE